MFQSHFHWMVPRRVLYLTCLFALLALMFTESAWTQTVTQADQVLHDRIAAIRQRIDTAASWHATDDQLGALWRQLANAHQDGRDIQRAEEAYTRSLKLLKASAQQRYFAAALDDLGSLYLETGRLKESESCRRKALAIFEESGDQAWQSRVHVSLAVISLEKRKFAESEEESAKALKSLKEQKEPDKDDLVSGLIVNSYAKCFQGRCDDGLRVAGQAMGLASATFAKDSLEVVTALMAVGFEGWKTGAQEDGERAMREALEIMHQKKNLPYATLVADQLKVFTSYTNYLKATHQKESAKQMENEIARLKGEQTPFCKNCTVNAVALSNAMR